MTKPARALALLLALSLPAAAHETWTVDDDAPADFATLQEAIDAAADGDVIVVRPGTYGGMRIHGKGLTVYGQAPAWIEVAVSGRPAVEISGTGAGQPVYLQVIEVLALGTQPTTAVSIVGCEGPVLIESCMILGPGTPAVVEESASVTFKSCMLHASPTVFDASAGPGFVTLPGIVARSSAVFLYDSLVAGGIGLDAGSYASAGSPDAGPAGPAVALRDAAELFASGSRLVGGPGGSGTPEDCGFGADGAPALHLEDAASVARVLGCELEPGVGGAGACGSPSGADAPAVVAAAGQVTRLPGPARSFGWGSRFFGPSTALVQLEGAPGDLVLLHAQLDAVPATFLAPYAIALHLEPSGATRVLGALPPSGKLDLALPMPPLGAGVESARLVGQALFFDAQGVHEGGPGMLVIVGPAL